MRLLKPLFLVLFISAILLAGCGYYFPHVYDGPSKTVYMPTWKNRTSQLGLDAKIYQSLARWFQRSKAITLTKNKEDSDMILAGEIINIDLPSISWDAEARATSVKVALVVRYILKDIKSDLILWEVPSELWTEDYSTEGGGTAIADNERSALEQILSDMSERIYLGTLDQLRKANKTVQPATK